MISDYVAEVARMKGRLKSPSGTFHVQESYLTIKKLKTNSADKHCEFSHFHKLDVCYSTYIFKSDLK